MWRALFLALGVSCCILGFEALAVEKAVLNVSQRGPSGASQSAQKVVQPPEWAPWSLLSGGAITIIYSFTIPARQKPK